MVITVVLKIQIQAAGPPDPQDAGTMVLRYVGNYLPVDMP
jgi:hypothetical protein